MPQIITTLGPYTAEQLGMILPHEHVFVDLRTGNPPGYAQAEVSAVLKLMGPELDKARAAGIGAIVEATPAGVGRRSGGIRHLQYPPFSCPLLLTSMMRRFCPPVKRKVKPVRGGPASD